MSIQIYTVHVHENGFKEWFKCGMHHRLDGPAIESCNGFKQYWIYGINIDCITVMIKDYFILKDRYLFV